MEGKKLISFGYQAFPWVLVVALLSFHLFKPKPVPDTSASEAAIREIKSDRDSLVKVIDLKNDTIQAIRHVQVRLEIEKEMADWRAKILKQKYESIRFRNFDSDTARIRELSKLYVSIRLE